MTASYRRGYMVRITASGILRAKGRMARTPITTSNTRIPRRRVQAPLRSPRTAPLFRHRDGHREVEVPPPARLEEQRYLHNEHLPPRGLDSPVGLAAYQRMQYLFQVPQCPGVTEYLAAEGFAVDTVRSSYTFPEAFDDPGNRPVVVLQKVVHDLIGRGRLRARQFTQKADQRTLARRERAGDGYSHRPFHGPSV